MKSEGACVFERKSESERERGPASLIVRQNTNVLFSRSQPRVKAVNVKERYNNTTEDVQ